MRKKSIIAVVVGAILCAIAALPWLWNTSASPSAAASTASGRYMRGLSSILKAVGLRDLGDRAWYEGQRIQEGFVFLDYPFMSKRHADALLDGARTASTNLGNDGSWGTNQTKELDARMILRFRVPKDHKLQYANAIEAADSAFRATP